jgi:DNA-binding transcriptional regulator WhiA
LKKTPICIQANHIRTVQKTSAKFHEIANGGKSVSVLRSFQSFKAVKLQHKNVPLTTIGKRQHPPIQTTTVIASHRGTRLTNQNRVNTLADDIESDGNC